MASLSTSPLPSTRVLNSFQVSPPSGTSPSRAIIPLTFLDIVWIKDPPLETLCFYPFPHLNSMSDHFTSFVSSLKSSLSHTLKFFYPLAGKLQRGTDDKFVIVYEEGDYVPFVVSECRNGRFDELAGFMPRNVSHLQPLVPCLSQSDESQPLFAIQVTIFPDQGVVLGITAHHSVCDGASLMQFTQSIISCLSGSSDSSIKPIIDRTLISDPLNIYTKINQANSKPKGTILVPISNKENDVFLATFTLNKENIQRLKQFISSTSEEMKKSFHCSTIVVVFAFAWVCYVKVKSREGEDSDKKHSLLFQVDFRTRVKPPIPQAYFGNFIGPCMVKGDRIDLISDNGVVLAAELIGKAIEELSYGEKLGNDLVRSLGFERNVSSLLTVAGSPRFRAYDADFGLEKPKKFEIVSIAKTGAIAVAESREELGGIEISIALNKSEMDCFAKSFIDGLKFEKLMFGV